MKTDYKIGDKFRITSCSSKECIGKTDFVEKIYDRGWHRFNQIEPVERVSDNMCSTGETEAKLPLENTTYGGKFEIKNLDMSTLVIGSSPQAGGSGGSDKYIPSNSRELKRTSEQIDEKVKKYLKRATEIVGVGITFPSPTIEADRSII